MKSWNQSDKAPSASEIQNQRNPNKSKDIRDWEDDAIVQLIKEMEIELRSLRYGDENIKVIVKKIEKILLELGFDRCFDHQGLRYFWFNYFWG